MSTMAKQLTKRGRERRRQLIDYATQRFAENGYHSTSVDELVNGLGVGKGVFYWYFDSKEELLVEILKETGHDLRRAQKLAIGDETDPVKRLELGIRATMRWLADNKDGFTLFQFAATQEGFAPIVRAEQDLALADTMIVVKEFAPSGSKKDAVALANAIIGVSNQLAQQLLIEKGQPPDTVADAAIAFCLGGLLGANGSRARAVKRSSRR
jgi:TetR/AcrR family fatty acid metabolism transcriptional regulator